MARVYGSRKRILVTEGAGFLGPHLIDRLPGMGHELLCSDKQFTGTRELGWGPAVQLRDGLGRTIDHFKREEFGEGLAPVAQLRPTV